MEDIRKLHITIPYGEFGSVQMDIDSKLGYTFKLLQDCFDNEEMLSNLNLNRYTTIQAELMMLDDNEFNTYFDKNEVDELKAKLNEEADLLRTLIETKDDDGKQSFKQSETKTRGCSDKFSKFDQRLNLLKQLTLGDEQLENEK